MKWLVTGGAGYIGAHVVGAMREAGESVVVLDDLSSGDPARIPGVTLVEGSVLDPALLTRVIRDESITGVVHIAAKKQVEESVRRPLFYYRENVEGLRVLLERAVAAGVASLVFSSSAAVYGMLDVDLVGEDTECRPLNPYGTTKLVGERMVADVAAATGLRYADLRHFNVAGTAALPSCCGPPTGLPRSHASSERNGVPLYPSWSVAEKKASSPAPNTTSAASP